MVKAHQAGEIINQRYEITHILGKGGVGITYSAVDLETNSTVAVKAVSLRQLDDWKQVELFEREASVLAKLDHPNIPKYLNCFDVETEKDKVFYIVQQQAPGKSLFQLVEGGWRTTEAEVKQIAEQVLSILIYLHSQTPPVIHRDIKPHNLIRSDDGKIFLVDFGAVQNTYYDTLTQGSTVVGTYGYMAPEQFRGKAEPATDLYSFGATILYLLTHRSPSELPQDSLKFDFRSQVNISEAFADWLEKVLELDPEDRFNSAKQALSKLNKKKSIHSNKYARRKLVAYLTFALAIFGIVKLNTYKFDILLGSEFYQKKVCNNTKLAKNYIKAGRELNTNLNFDNTTKSFLSCLIGKKDLELINLIKNKKSNIKNKKTYNHIMLFWAIYNQDVVKVEELINKSIDINIKINKNIKCQPYGKYYCDYYYCTTPTPLYESIIQSNLEIVRLLVNNGAELNEYCKSSKTDIVQVDNFITPLSRAVSLNNPQITNYLLENGAKIDALSMPHTLADAIKQNNLNVIEILLKNGLNISETNEFSRIESLNTEPSTLFSPPKGGSWKATKIVEYNSLLHFAQLNRKEEIIKLFYQYTDSNSEN